MLRYPCLVLDHDDTTVDSTRSVNYPQLCQALAVLRPEIHLSLEEFAAYCYDPGFYGFCDQVLRYTPQELETHVGLWKDYHRTHHPPFFPGIPALLARQKQEGGLVCVVSHSNEDVIRAAYDHAGVPQPDLILGAELPPAQRKPNPWPLEEIMRRYDLTPRQLLVADDMQLGVTMAHAAGVQAAGAGWGCLLPRISREMERQCDFFFPTVQAFSEFLFP